MSLEDKRDGAPTVMGGFIRARHRTGINIESPRPDELSQPDAAVAQSLFGKPAHALQGRKTKLAALLTLDKSILEKGDPQYLEALKQAHLFRKHRQKELYVTHGYVSAGVSALLTTSALALASSRYMYERAAVSGDLDMMRRAAMMADSSRQSELAAWELCARESVVKKKQEINNAGVPWFEQPTNSGGKRRRGRPRKTPIEVDGQPIAVVQNNARNDSRAIESGSPEGSWTRDGAVGEAESVSPTAEVQHDSSTDPGEQLWSAGG